MEHVSLRAFYITVYSTLNLNELLIVYMGCEYIGRILPKRIFM